VTIVKGKQTDYNLFPTIGAIKTE